MPPKFGPGAIAYTASGRRFTIEDVADGTAYCVGDNGAEAEFAETALLTEAEFLAQSEKRGVNIYSRVKQSKLFTAPPGKFDRALAATLLTRIEKLTPGILDFTAFTIASRALAEAGESDRAAGLAISKCRALFDEAPPERRAALLAALLGTPPEVLANAARLGDNLMRALIEKGMAAHATAFDEFCDRPRS